MWEKVIENLLVKWGFKPEQLKVTINNAVQSLQQYDRRLSGAECALERINTKLNILLHAEGMDIQKIDMDITAAQNAARATAILLPPTVGDIGNA